MSSTTTTTAAAIHNLVDVLALLPLKRRRPFMPALHKLVDLLTPDARGAANHGTYAVVCGPNHAETSRRGREASLESRRRSAAARIEEHGPLACQLREDGKTFAEIAEALNDSGYRTARGKPYDRATALHLYHAACHS